MKTYKGKKIKIEDFTPVIPFEQIEAIVGKRNYKNFLKFIEGQTILNEGAFVCDVEAWLLGLKFID